MERRMRTKAILLISLFLCTLAIAVQAQRFDDIKPDHWAYESVEKLAEKGLVLGYPDGKFLGGRSLSRYEMATIIARIIEMIESEHADMNSRIQAAATKGTTVKTEDGKVVPAATPEDVAALRKLIDEFKVELTVIGTDLSKLKEDVSAMKDDMETVKATVSDPEGALQTAVADIKGLKSVKFSGYIQARWESGKATSATANDNYNGFFLRRARFKLAATKGNTQIVLNPNFGSSGYRNRTDGIAIQGTDAEKDYYIQYNFMGDAAIGPSIWIGQFNWPFGYDVPYSSSLRECPERARVSRALFDGERDRGIKIASATTANPTWEIALMNGSGVKSGNGEKNQHKDVVGNIRFALGKVADLGISGYYGKHNQADYASPYLKADKTRYGADLQIYLPDTTIKAEYIAGKENRIAGTPAAEVEYNVSGWWAQIARNLGKRDTIVARYDTYDPDDPASTYGKLSAWNVGLIHHLDDATKVKVFYEFNKEQRNRIRNNVTRVEWVSSF